MNKTEQEIRAKDLQRIEKIIQKINNAQEMIFEIDNIIQKNKKHNILTPQELKAFECEIKYAEEAINNYNEELKSFWDKYELNYTEIVKDL